MAASGYIDVYTTVAGDMWDKISYNVYGAEQYMGDLMKANPDLAQTVVFDGGVEIVVPDIVIPAAATLPAWV